MTSKVRAWETEGSNPPLTELQRPWMHLVLKEDQELSLQHIKFEIPVNNIGEK